MTNAQVTALHYGLIGFFALWTVILVPQLITHFARYGRPRLRSLVTTALCQPSRMACLLGPDR